MSLLALSAISSTQSSSASEVLRASYVFRPSANGVVPDESGNKHDASVFLEGSGGWVDTDVGPAVELKNPGDRIELPPSAFPGKRGSLKISFRPSSDEAESQYLFRIYSGSGDGLTLYLKEGILHFRYHNRAAGTNVSASLPAGVVKPGEWTTATISWDLEDEWRMLVRIDETRKAVVPVKSDLEVRFDPESQVVVGSEHAGSATFFGTIHSLEIFDEPIWETTAISSKKKTSLKSPK